MSFIACIKKKYFHRNVTAITFPVDLKIYLSFSQLILIRLASSDVYDPGTQIKQ